MPLSHLRAFFRHGDALASLIALAASFLVAFVLKLVIVSVLTGAVEERGEQALIDFALDYRFEPPEQTAPIAPVTNQLEVTFFTVDGAAHPSLDPRLARHVQHLGAVLDRQPANGYASVLLSEDLDPARMMGEPPWFLIATRLSDRTDSFLLMRLVEEPDLLKRLKPVLYLMAPLIFIPALFFSFMTFRRLNASVMDVADYFDQLLSIGNLNAPPPRKVVPELRRIATSAQTAMARLQGAHALALGTLGDLSHDLGNTKFSIQRRCDTLAKEGDWESISDELNLMMQKFQELSDLQLQLYTSSLSPKVQDLSTFLQDLGADFIAPELESVDLTLSCEVPPGIHARFSQGNLIRTLENLTYNAVKYTRPKGHVNLHLDVEGDGADRAAVIRFESAPSKGVTLADGQVLGERWTRSREAQEEGQHGSGLGLLAVIRHMQMSGGRAILPTREDLARDPDRFCVRLELPLPGR